MLHKKERERTMRAMTILAALIGTAAPALAGWQGTEWGMPVDQTIAATGAMENSDRRWDTPAGPAQLTLPYEAAGVPTNAYFYFDRDGGLSFVTLVALDPVHCRQLLAALLTAYHTPPAGHGLQWQWKDGEHRNLVDYSFIPPDYCEVRYSPLLTPGGAGGV